MDYCSTFQRDPYRLRAGLTVAGLGRPALFIYVSQSDWGGSVRLRPDWTEGSGWSDSVIDWYWTRIGLVLDCRGGVQSNFDWCIPVI